MPTFEEGFEQTEQAAADAARAAQALARSARALERAAKAGDISKMRSAAALLSESSETARQDATNATDAWPFSPEATTAYFREGYEQELIKEGQLVGLSIHRVESKLSVFPKMVQIAPDRSAVVMDGKHLPTTRPSRVVERLKREQEKTPPSSQRFLESLYQTYCDGVEKSLRGTPYRLTDIYRRLTRLPGVSRTYNRLDFCRDLYLLDRSGLQETRRGAKFTFSASTGTRQSQRLEFVDRDGHVVTYYAISFTESR